MRNPDEVSDDLSGPIDIERVIDSNEERTYDILGVEVLILDDHVDSSGDCFNDCALQSTNPIQVVRSHSSAFVDVIGYANLFRQGKTIIADIFLRYDCPERLAHESGSKLYPSAAGEVLNYQYNTSTNVRTITHAKLTAISLDFTKNADPRIGPLP